MKGSSFVPPCALVCPSLSEDEEFGSLRRVKATPAASFRLCELHQFDIPETGQMSHRVDTSGRKRVVRSAVCGGSVCGCGVACMCSVCPVCGVCQIPSFCLSVVGSSCVRCVCSRGERFTENEWATTKTKTKQLGNEGEKTIWIPKFYSWRKLPFLPFITLFKTLHTL